MREKFSVTSDAAFTPNTETFRLRGENPFQRCRKTMTGLFAADDVFAGDPIELNHAPLAAERFVSVPGVFATLESQQRSFRRRPFQDHVVAIIRGTRQPQSSSRR